MSDTPRTDAACGLPSNDWETTAVRLCEEAIKLERELADWQKELRIVTADRDGLMTINAQHRETIAREKHQASVNAQAADNWLEEAKSLSIQCENQLQELTELRKDKARLDWLDDRFHVTWAVGIKDPMDMRLLPLRDSIDHSMLAHP